MLASGDPQIHSFRGRSLFIHLHSQSFIHNHSFTIVRLLDSHEFIEKVHLNSKRQHCDNLEERYLQIYCLLQFAKFLSISLSFLVLVTVTWAGIGKENEYDTRPEEWVEETMNWL